MDWHLILMIVWSLCYIVWKIYLYSTSLKFAYTKSSTGKMCNFKRWKNRMKYILEGYFKWYGFEHFKTVLIAWVIYGGFFIW